MKSGPKITLRIVSVLSALCAIWGIAFNGWMVLCVSMDWLPLRHFQESFRDPLPYFYQAFVPILAVSTILNVFLLRYSIQLFTPNWNCLWRYSYLLWIEVFLFLALGVFWTSHVYAMSVGAATTFGYAGSLLPQFFTLLPITGPMAIFIARRFEHKNIHAGRTSPAISSSDAL